MSNPIIKVARPGYDVTAASAKDLSFSSEWETPKIFMQTQSSWTNTLGYIPSYFSFRKLNTTDYCHDMLLNIDTDPYQGSYINLDGNLVVNTRSGDSGSSVILYFNSLNQTPPLTISNSTKPSLIVAKDGYDTSTFPTNSSLDSRFDTFKIKNTGTLTLTMSGETILAGGSNKTYSTNYQHSLGYPPMYLPIVGSGWNLGVGFIDDVSFVVNDYIGYVGAGGGYTGISELNVYVDSDKLYMDYVRLANEFVDTNFSAVTVTMYYTLFYNDISEEFNLL
jgi:hypothetical protein